MSHSSNDNPTSKVGNKWSWCWWKRKKKRLSEITLEAKCQTSSRVSVTSDLFNDWAYQSRRFPSHSVTTCDWLNRRENRLTRGSTDSTASLYRQSPRASSPSSVQGRLSVDVVSLGLSPTTHHRGGDRKTKCSHCSSEGDDETESRCCPHGINLTNWPPAYCYDWPWCDPFTFAGMNKTTIPRTPVPKSRKRLYIAAFIGNILYLSVGCVMGWPSPTIPQLELDGELTQEEAPWLNSLYCIGAAMGPLLTVFTIDTIGRKITILFICLIFMISWLTLGLTDQIAVMYFGRIVGGVGVGAAFSSMSVYLAEISDNEVRGAIGSVNQMFVGMGLVIQYSAGPYVKYFSLTMISFSLAICFALGFLFLPESPHYLVAKDRKEEAVNALCWLRSAKPPQVQKELIEIEECLEQSKAEASSIKNLFMKRGPRKALIISIWAMLCQQVTGVNVVLSSAESIFTMATSSISPQISSIIVGSVNVISSSFAPPLVRRFGLKLVMISAGFGMATCQIFLSTFFYLKQNGHDVSGLSWLPITCLILFNIFFCIGPGPLPWASVAEMFPLQLKGKASCIIGVWVWLLSFTVMKTYGDLLLAWGPGGVFLLFGVGEIAVLTVMIWLQPQTKGLSFQEIQDLLDGRTLPDESEES